VEPADARIELWLARHALTAWHAVLRPWLEAGRGRLERTYVIVATRGQAQALKQRCLTEGLPLLGVEFLTPGLARQKWRAHDQDAGRPVVPVMGRELLLLGLRVLIAGRLEPLRPDQEEWGYWQSLKSDPERALDDFDALLKAGFRAEDFPQPALRDLFVALTSWVHACGYGLAPLEAEAAGLALRPAGVPVMGARVMVYLPGVELWGEFFNMAAFVRRCPQISVVLPEPAWRGRSELDERWVALWQDLLGVSALPVDADPPGSECESVGRLWLGGQGSADQAGVLIGRNRAEEMELAATQIEAWLAEGAEAVGVVFPGADASHLRLAECLRRRGVVYADWLETAGPPPVDAQAQRALLEYHGGGARLEGLLALWPLLRALGVVTLPSSAVRRACERSFDLRQTHAVEAYRDEFSRQEPELARVIAALGPLWPDKLTLADALERFRLICASLEVAPPEGWSALERFAEQEARPLPKAAVIAALASFVPQKQAVRSAAAGRTVFARVILGTRRRMEGVPWTHLLLVESNAGTWPDPARGSCWLTDDDRQQLNTRSRFGLGLFTSEDRRALERAGYGALARDTATQVVFTAALADEQDPETPLAPNAWLERVMWAKGWFDDEQDPARVFARGCRRPRTNPGPCEDVGPWFDIWRGRRDPLRPFDEYFLAGPPDLVRPEALSARLIERGLGDPAELWFEGVLGLSRLPWGPLTRARRKALGLWAHDVLARALAGVETQQAFVPLPSPEDARGRMEQALERLRRRWPDDAYWQSFHAELSRLARHLLDNVFTLGAGPFVAVERRLPAAASVAIGGSTLPVKGRMDLVLLDRPDWRDAFVDVVDFKTGGDADLSAERMATGASVQLGIYLAAVLSLGARDGRVWMIKPEPGACSSIAASELSDALTALGWLGQALRTGVYGALTRDRSEYAPDGYEWPLACTPIPFGVLRRKYAATFGDGGEEADRV